MSDALPGGSQPLNARELQISNVVLWQGTVGLIELRGQRATANPVASLILLEDCRVEWIHAVEFEDHTAIQQGSKLHRIIRFFSYSFLEDRVVSVVDEARAHCLGVFNLGEGADLHAK